MLNDFQNEVLELEEFRKTHDVKTLRYPEESDEYHSSSFIANVVPLLKDGWIEFWSEIDDDYAEVILIKKRD